MHIMASFVFSCLVTPRMRQLADNLCPEILGTTHIGLIIHYNLYFISLFFLLLWASIICYYTRLMQHDTIHLSLLLPAFYILEEVFGFHTIVRMSNEMVLVQDKTATSIEIPVYFRNMVPKLKRSRQRRCFFSFKGCCILRHSTCGLSLWIPTECTANLPRGVHGGVTLSSHLYMIFVL
jgi:hypothetical protein